MLLLVEEKLASDLRHNSKPDDSGRYLTFFLFLCRQLQLASLLPAAPAALSDSVSEIE